MTEPAVLTVQEAAGLLRVSHWTVGSMVRDGRLPRVPGLRRIRIPVRAVQALLEGYDVRNGEPHWTPSPKAPASRRRPTATMGGPGLAAPEPISCDEPPQLDPVVVRRIREV